MKELIAIILHLENLERPEAAQWESGPTLSGQKMIAGQNLLKGKVGTGKKIPELAELLGMCLLYPQLLSGMQSTVLGAAGHPHS